MKIVSCALLVILAIMWYCSAATKPTFYLHLQGKDQHQTLSFSEEQSKISSNSLECTLLNYIPKSHQKLRCCHENQIDIYLQKETQSIPLSTSLKFHPLEETDWLVTAIKANVAEIIPQLQARAKEANKSIFAIIQDDQLVEYTATISKNCELKLSSMSSLLKESLVTLKGAREGYGLEIPLEQKSIYLKVWPSAQKASDQKYFDPSFYVCFSEGDSSEILCLIASSPAYALLQWPLFNGKYLVHISKESQTK